MDLFLRGPSRRTELTVTDSFGFDVIQTVSLREERQTTNDNECHRRDSNERPCLFVQVVHLISVWFLTSSAVPSTLPMAFVVPGILPPTQSVSAFVSAVA